MQYKIPQNVGIEDKIVGPLTLRQLIILAVGIGISYVLFAILNKLYELNILEYIIIAIPALLAAAFALIKINDIRLLKYVFLFLEFSIKPKRRIWDHRGIATLVSPELIEVKKGEGISEAENLIELKAKRAANLRDLTKALDSGGFEHVRAVEHEDIDVTEDDDLVTQAYFGHKRGESATENMYWRTKDAHMKMLDAFAAMPVTSLKKGSKEAKAAMEEIAKVKKEVAEMQKTAPQTAATEAPAKKKPRKRQRNLPKPVRQGTVNTTDKKKPAEYIANKPPKKQAKPKSDAKNNKKGGKKGGEFDFRELEKGEIEINLD